LGTYSQFTIEHLVEHGFRHRDISDGKGGLTVFRIIRDQLLTKFRKLGFIEHNGGLKLHSSLLNVIVHEQVRPVVATRVVCSPASPANVATGIGARG
jgi:hypothetical protein